MSGGRKQKQSGQGGLTKSLEGQIKNERGRNPSGLRNSFMTHINHFSQHILIKHHAVLFTVDWTLVSLRQISDSSLNHEITPTGDGGSIDVDSVGRELKIEGIHCELLWQRQSLLHAYGLLNLSYLFFRLTTTKVKQPLRSHSWEDI